MGFFLDIIRDSRRTVMGQPDAGSVQWDEVVEGHLGPEQGSVADLRDVEPRLKRAPNGPFSPGPPSAESRDAGWDEERFVFSGPENPADDALAESPENDAPPRKTYRPAEGSRSAVSSRIARPSGSSALQRKPLASASVNAEGSDPLGGGLSRDSSAETVARRRQSNQKEACAVSSAVAEVDGLRPSGDSEAPSPFPLPANRSGPETRLHDPSAPSAETHSAGRMRGGDGSTEPRYAPGSVTAAKPAAASGAGGTSIRLTSPRRETSPEGSHPKVRIGQVNVIVQSDRATQRPKSSSIQGEDLASRTFLRSL